ncbi:MAG: alpha/beta hydrolase [Acidimicrobiia bacterium]|nr:alpha/beta hydrolase [Acidimicrobiia bacterium]
MSDSPSGSPWGDGNRPIVLVHGAWVGEWSWLPVLPRLKASGRAVHNVSLTGQGARRHQGGNHLHLLDHVDDVVGVIQTLDLRAVTLVGHSYGGRVITGVAGRVPDRLDAMVYLDAHAPIAPDPGQTPERLAAAEANDGMLPFGGYDLDPAFFGGLDGVAWCRERLVDHPMACFTDPWVVELPDRIVKTYVYAASPEPTKFSAYSAAAKADPGWHHHQLEGPHFLMYSHPDEVTAIILDADAGPPDRPSQSNSSSRAPSGP